MPTREAILHRNDASCRRALAIREVVVATGSLLLLASIAGLTLSRTRDDQRAVACAENLSVLHMGLTALQQEFPGFYAPAPDDGSSAWTRGHKGIVATWVDLLQQRAYIPGRQPGYCPADRLPDPLNAARGSTWGFKYPAALGGGPGADHSYAVSIPYATDADPAKFPCWDPDGDPDRRVIVADGLWPWMQGLGNPAVVQRPLGRWDSPYWANNIVGYRHKYAANLLHRDGHVALVAYDRDPEDLNPGCNETGGIDTTEHFIWRPGEHVHVGYASAFNSCNEPPRCRDYPTGQAVAPELDPSWYTKNDAWTIPDIHEYKGWTRP